MKRLYSKFDQILNRKLLSPHLYRFLFKVISLFLEPAVPFQQDTLNLVQNVPSDFTLLFRLFHLHTSWIISIYIACFNNNISL